MATKRNSRKSRTISPDVLGKPRGVIQPRVQKVGPEHFGIVAVDCAKVRSKWMLCDFYGKVLIPPTIVEHQRAALETATMQLREAIKEHGLQDHIVAVEMTGTYHRPVQRAFRKAGSETRLVHPLASRHFRLTIHGDNKTDDHDLEGIFRAAVNGFGLIEAPWDETLPAVAVAGAGIAAIWSRSGPSCKVRFANRCNAVCRATRTSFPRTISGHGPVAMAVARRAARPEVIRAAGISGRDALARRRPSFARRRGPSSGLWPGPRNAAAADPLCEHLLRVWQTLYEDWQAKTRQIARLEQELAGILVKTPYLLLLSHPGINVVTRQRAGRRDGTHRALRPCQGDLRPCRVVSLALSKRRSGSSRTARCRVFAMRACGRPGCALPTA